MDAISTMDQLWTRVSQAGKFDPGLAQLHSLRLTYTPQAELVELLMFGTTPDRRALTVSWSGIGHPHARTGDVVVNVSPPGTALLLEQSPRIEEILQALDQVGAETMLSAIDENATIDSYSVTALRGPNDSSSGIPTDQRAMLWDGTRFVELPPEDSRRTYAAVTGVFLVVYPMVATTSSSTAQQDQTLITTTGRSLAPTFYVICN
jgi:hypothetical protein